MDINDFRSLQTVLAFIAFIGIVIWAYSKRRKKSFDDAANLPFADEDQHESTVKRENKK
ncbi:MAG: cbb3-type cytochrome c oxidase subunit 3 [Gammaproteobacteria bacterium]|nr:cbb3-type cytochrome c oxidase subunit 3 [Gammaproteobacteria bacterium]